MLSARGGDGEGLLHETVWFVAIAVWAFIRIAVLAGRGSSTGALGSLYCWYKAISSPLALHFSIGQEAARHAACTPGFPVRPSSHASLPLVPYEDGAGLDLLSFFFGESALHPWQQAYATGFEEEDGVRWSANVAVVGLHWGVGVPDAVELGVGRGTERKGDEKKKNVGIENTWRCGEAADLKLHGYGYGSEYLG
jgi:hypothetical protein